MVLESCFGDGDGTVNSHCQYRNVHICYVSPLISICPKIVCLEAKYMSEVHLTYPYMVACMWSAFL